MEACLVVLQGRAGRPGEAELVYRPALPDLWRVPDALVRIRSALTKHPEGGDLFGFLPPIAADDAQRPLKVRAAVASTFLAGLELARIGVAEAAQEEAFGAVRLWAPPHGANDQGVDVTPG